MVPASVRLSEIQSYWLGSTCKHLLVPYYINSRQIHSNYSECSTNSLIGNISYIEKASLSIRECSLTIRIL